MDKTIKEILEYLVSKEMAELRYKLRYKTNTEDREELNYLSDLFDRLTEIS